jgi:hypothetical protein
VNAEFADIRNCLRISNFRPITISRFWCANRFSGVTESILIGLGLSVLVLMGFLKSWRITVVAAAVIPIAVFIAIVFMRLFNMSFNLMTLGGIAACIGESSTTRL